MYDCLILDELLLPSCIGNVENLSSNDMADEESFYCCTELMAEPNESSQKPTGSSSFVCEKFVTTIKIKSMTRIFQFSFKTLPCHSCK